MPKSPSPGDRPAAAPRHACDNDVYNNHKMISYSQEGEDIILQHLVGGKPEGFYIDIGAHHPTRFSNTRKFYEYGWHGINIEPMPGIMALFREHRPRDINLEIGIGSQEAELPFYMFNEPALNTFSRQYADEILHNPSVQLVETRPIRVRPLRDVLRECQVAGPIDFMSIDTEAFELEVLGSNDWDRFRPKYLVIETLGGLLEQYRDCPIYRFLARHGYRVFAKTIKSYVYQDRNLPG